MDPKKDIVSLIHNNEVICIAGINHLRIGVGEVWLISSDLINKCKFEFYKTVRGLVKFVMEKMGIHRCELAIDLRWKEGHKWATSLGFKFESIARAYDFNFNNHAIYTRIERWQ